MCARLWKNIKDTVFKDFKDILKKDGPCWSCIFSDKSVSKRATTASADLLSQLFPAVLGYVRTSLGAASGHVVATLRNAWTRPAITGATWGHETAIGGFIPPKRVGQLGEIMYQSTNQNNCVWLWCWVQIKRNGEQPECVCSPQSWEIYSSVAYITIFHNFSHKLLFITILRFSKKDHANWKSQLPCSDSAIWGYGRCKYANEGFLRCWLRGNLSHHNPPENQCCLSWLVRVPRSLSNAWRDKADQQGNASNRSQVPLFQQKKKRKDTISLGNERIVF